MLGCAIVPDRHSWVYRLDVPLLSLPASTTTQLERGELQCNTTLNRVLLLLGALLATGATRRTHIHDVAEPAALLARTSQEVHARFLTIILAVKAAEAIAGALFAVGADAAVKDVGRAFLRLLEFAQVRGALHRRGERQQEEEEREDAVHVACDDDLCEPTRKCSDV